MSFVSQGLGELSAAINEILQGISGGFTFEDIRRQVPKSRMEEFNQMVGELLPKSRTAKGIMGIGDRLVNLGGQGNIERASNIAIPSDVLNKLKAEFVPSSAPAKVQISQELLDSARSVKIDNLKSEIELEAKRLTQRSEEQDVIRKTNEVRAIESKIALKKFELDKTEEGVRKDKLTDQLEELRLQRQ